MATAPGKGEVQRGKTAQGFLPLVGYAAAMDRLLSDMERAFYLLDRGTRFNGVQVVRVAPTLDAALLRQALLHLQAQHPLLRIRLRGDDRRLFITDQGAGPLPLSVRPLVADTDWIAHAEAELNQPFLLTDDHLSRLRLLQGPAYSDLIFAHHHLLADALSVIFVFRDLLSLLASGRGPDSLPTRLPPRPPMPALLPPKGRGLGLLGPMNRFFWKHVAARPFRRARKMPIETWVPPGERKNRVFHRTLDFGTTLLNCARSENTTVHGAVAAALLLATATEVFADRIATGKTTRVGCFAAVNLRAELQPEVQQEMGLYISQVTTFHRLVPLPNFWQLARQVRQELSVTLKSGEQYLTLPLIGLFIPARGDVASRFVRRFDGASPGLTGLTNLQKLPIPLTYGPLSIVDYQITVGVSVVGQLLLAVTTVRDKINLNFIFVEPLVSAGRATRIADSVVHLLKQAVGPTA